ncbi:MAG: site-specific integrase [Nocardioidaceae bacterium]|nr:site-specific integrase [Nocardioidaceae bacterium]
MLLPTEGRRPIQDVKVFGVQRRGSSTRHRRPWIVRWSLDGRQHSKSFRTRAEAERYRSVLMQAQRTGQTFDVGGEPASWLPAPEDVQMHDWARRWLAEQWAEWQPRTRASAVEALARFVPLLVHPTAPPAPQGLRGYLLRSLPPGLVSTEDPCERWLARWCLQLGQLNRQQLADVEQRLGLGANGTPLGASTAGRFRKTAKACVRRAVELDILPADPWPPASRGRAQRKSVRVRRAVDTGRLPDPATMAAAIAAIATQQPASRTYQAMTAVAYYGGLRPAEVVMLRPRHLHLPEQGWGRIDVHEADVGHDEPGEPKTGPRSVPVPPQLVTVLRDWIGAHAFTDDEFIFRTRSGKRPTASNWARSWRRALREIGHRPLRVYDCRHAAATTWLRAGVPLGDVARRMGHSVETLVSTYVGALAGDEELANERIGTALR